MFGDLNVNWSIMSLLEIIVINKCGGLYFCSFVFGGVM